jgi:hypothetical protein
MKITCGAKPMKRRTRKAFVCGIFAGVFLVACAGTRLTTTRVDEAHQGKPVSNILVIMVSHKDEIRRSFENRFVAQLKATGIQAVSSANAIPIPADQELEKDVILTTVNKLGNDAVIITYLLAVEDKEIYTPPGGGRAGYYSHYDYVYRFSHDPGYFNTRTTVRVKTNLYDVKTEKLIWSGQAETVNPESKRQVIDEVIQTVIKDLQKNKLLPTQ